MNPVTTAASPAQNEGSTTPDLLKGLVPGRSVYFWENEINVGLAPNPAIVVQVHKDSTGKPSGAVRLFVMFRDGADGTKPSIAFADIPAANRWTWPMGADGSPNRD
jgi:hypothetical protein